MSQTDLKIRSQNKNQRPKQYVVKFVNDDFTPMDFVVEVMVRVFKLGVEEAEKKTMEIHTRGHAVHGPMTHEIAETRATSAMNWAKEYELPFRCSVEQG